MKNISAEVSIFSLWTDWRHLVTCRKIELRELYYCNRCALDKICEIYTFDRLAKNHSWLLATQKKGLREQLNYFWYMCPISSPWEKNKRTLFPDGKSRGPFLARAALNSYYRNNCYWLNKLATNKSSRVIVFRKE